MSTGLRDTEGRSSTHHILQTCVKMGEQDLVLLIAVREGVHVRVVDQRVVAISPGELPDPEVVIGNKLRGGVGALVSHAESVHVTEDDDGNGSKDKSLLPNLEATPMAAAHLPGNGRRLGGDAEELLVRPC